MKHMGLFEGIGGFSLAAYWAGWETPVMVEWDIYCQAVLKKNFSNASIFGDIRQFDGKPYAGLIDIITGGFPCQPYSEAGKRKGNDDERALWPEMLRVIREVGPNWVVAENVGGIISMDCGRVLDGILSDLENEGFWNYEDESGKKKVAPLIIPAVAVGAPHRRDRVWIIAHANNKQRDRRGGTRGRGSEFADENIETIAHALRIGRQIGRHGSGAIQKTGIGRKENDQPCNGVGRHEGIAPNAFGPRFSRSERSEPCWASGSVTEPNRTFGGWGEHWYEVATRICRVGDGVPAGLDGIGEIPANAPSKKGGKAQRIKALGNAIVPQIAFEIFNAINEHDRT